MQCLAFLAFTVLLAHAFGLRQNWRLYETAEALGAAVA